MADEYGPFDGFPWAEAQWYEHAPVWAPSGVVGSPAAAATSGALAFSASGLSVSAGAGKAWIRGAGFKRTGTPPTHAVAANANASLSRRDRLVLRRNLATHLVETAVIQGTPSGTPAAPALTQVEVGVWEETLFSFLVPPNNGTTITGVVDERAWVNPGGQVWRAPGPLITSGITGVGNWTVISSSRQNLGNGMAYLQVVAERKNSDLSIPDDTGNPANSDVAALPAAWAPLTPYANLSSMGTGRMSVGFIDTASGTVRFSATVPGPDINVDDLIELAGTYMLANPAAAL